MRSLSYIAGLRAEDLGNMKNSRPQLSVAAETLGVSGRIGACDSSRVTIDGVIYTGRCV